MSEQIHLKKEQFRKEQIEEISLPADSKFLSLYT